MVLKLGGKTVRDIFPRPVFGSLRLQVLVVACCLATQPVKAQAPAGSTAYEIKGTVKAVREAEIAARVDGRLVHINFTAGQIVKEGDLLFEFDMRYRQISLAAAQAKQKLTEAQLQLSELKLKNTETLRARNVSSDMQFMEAQAQRDVAAAGTDEAKANVQAAQLQLDEMKLFAPIDGVISEPFVREGAYLTLEALGQNRLAVIFQLNPIQVVGEIPFNDYLQRRETFDGGREASKMLEYTLVLPNGEKYSHKGRLVAGTGEFNPATQVMAIAIEFENPEFLLRPGLKVTLQSSAPGR
jgi:RND family efflux transporter MFP subunit